MASETSKTRFQSSKGNITNHHAIVDSEAFTRGADAAMLEVCERLASRVRDGASAAEAGFLLRGAVLFKYEFQMLADPPQSIPKEGPAHNLAETDQAKRN